MRILHVSLVSVLESLENEQCKGTRKSDQEELKLLVGEANYHFDELEQQNLSITGKKHFIERSLLKLLGNQ